jgi:hypothetical protein
MIGITFGMFTVLSSNYSNSEGVAFILLWCEVKDIIRKQVCAESNENDYGKRDKPCAVVNRRKKGD